MNQEGSIVHIEYPDPDRYFKAYKWLFFKQYSKCRTYFSNRFDVIWYWNTRRGVFLKSDNTPDWNNQSGIHCFKSTKDKENKLFERSFYNKAWGNENFTGYVFVELLLDKWYVIMETERGYRSQYAQINNILKEVIVNEYRQRYQKTSWERS